MVYKYVRSRWFTWKKQSDAARDKVLLSRRCECAQEQKSQQKERKKKTEGAKGREVDNK